MNNEQRDEILEDEKVRHGYRERQAFYQSWITAALVAVIVFCAAFFSTNIGWQAALGFAALLGIVIGFGKEIT